MWSLVLSDLAGSALGEVGNASERKVRLPLNRVPTVSFTVRRDHPLVPYLLLDDKTLVKAYDDKTLRALGPIVVHEKAADSSGGGSLQVTAAGVGVRLGGRLIGKHAGGVTYGPQDRGATAQQIIADARMGGDEADHDHGVRIGAITPSVVSTSGPWYFKPALEALTDLSSALDGFDWEIAPTEPAADGQGLKLGVLNCAPRIGALRPDAVFEYGTGRHNVKEFRDTGNAQSLCNWGFNLPQGYPDNATAPVVDAHDQPSIDERGLWEAVISGDVPDDTVRARLTQLQVYDRRAPTRVVSFQPVADDGTGRVPKFGTDYIVGDTVPFRAVENGVTTIDEQMRVYVVEMQIDDEGKASPQLVFVQEGQ